MRASGDPASVNRADHPDAVEGLSEIDTVISGPGYTVYVEAKLGSDISPGTTHDPERNQIVRNIDCVIEHRHGTPLFWMFVTDRDPSHAYMQTIDRTARTPRFSPPHSLTATRRPSPESGPGSR